MSVPVQSVHRVQMELDVGYLDLQRQLDLRGYSNKQCPASRDSDPQSE